MIRLSVRLASQRCKILCDGFPGNVKSQWIQEKPRGFLVYSICSLFLFSLFSFFFLFFFFSFFFGLFRAAPAACGGSQARRGIRVVAAGLTTATATRGPSYICDLCHISRQHQILNPLTKARNQTCVLMDAS